MSVSSYLVYLVKQNIVWRNLFYSEQQLNILAKVTMTLKNRTWEIYNKNEN